MRSKHRGLPALLWRCSKQPAGLPMSLACATGSSCLTLLMDM